MYAQEGSYGDAALSCAGAVPVLGWLATGAKFAKNAFKAASKACSFEGDTLVLMADGTSKPIKDVQEGDEVANSEPESEESEEHEVVEVHVTDEDKDYVDLTIDTPDGPKTITTTGNHPFYSVSAGTWIDAAALEPGDQLNSQGNGRVDVDSTRRYTATLRTFNLSIETVHTYYVLAGKTPVLVHNTCVEEDAFRIEEHVNPRHMPGGALTAGKSIFNENEDLLSLAQETTTQIGVRQVGTGRIECVIDAHRPIGKDVNGIETSVYTVIRTGGREVYAADFLEFGDLVTMHPGTP